MAVTANSIITPQTPFAQFTDFSVKTACTTRAPLPTASLAGANIFIIANTSTNGCLINQITLKGSSTSFTAATVAQTVTIWQWDGTTAWPVDELVISAVTPSTTTPSFKLDTYYINWILPATNALYASTSITTTAATTAFDIRVSGGLL